ncbi:MULTISPECIES: ABC transporter ATP-binding protein [Chryseobacterium]|uniref:ATP-binding cassette subfamily B multidrug efflux pump n=1 Tax=Chryseobacterium camelliae TaxID=1265445 RepID=A0ABU0TKR6_9FLAO|nr:MULTISPECIES: ABC transporter ATP-binding protein [Chryseobacterium]MDT3408513.1 ATP-binding cassette subfamily B multidrug efflux pump [Pseudacidovorax intermedius]MDQ1097632.1 ATP-binding cassette subfamily B multidrug efflux pump [Chryseobacterium camelliae]MDQ1101561.1 ATP-binding cassette subfamily B multidrug efflux pump [Chryseobacterium sp. SORGH_AS_1048]MDR6085004.1 ATP-binding cassette subfamily B multidrug efflux pump [Chryseobacterium sp. SORGH_AS_0909]MDR6129358.1 ATP-binding c
MKKQDTGGIIRRLFFIGMKFRSWFILTLIISIILSVVSTYRPYLTMEVVDNDITRLKDKGLMMQHIYILVGLVFAETILNFFLVYFSNFISQNVIRDIRERLYAKLIYFRTSFFDKTPIGQLVTRAVGDVETIATVYTDGFLMVFGDILRIVFVLVMMFSTNVHLSYITLAILPLMVVITRFFQKRLKKAFGDERTWTATQNSFVQERLAGMPIIQVFNRQEAEFKKFDEINITLKEALLRTVFIFSLFFPVVELISSLFIGFILFYGGYITISAGVVIAFIQYISMLIRPLRQIADRFNNIQRGIVGAERVLGLMDEDNSMPNNGTVAKDHFDGKIEFSNVHFAYDEKQEVLKGIDFKVNPGETVAIVGATGAGKSTIISLITRLYDINSGNILIDDIDLKDYELYNLRSHIGVVLQDVFLFHGSIFENLAFGDDTITLEKIKAGARQIEVDQFIEQLPGGYDYVVSERGSSISLGQRQLLSFLRAYLSDPKILILDEATSSIDHESEKLIQRATEKLTKGRTSIIIAHRLSTIEKADKIIVMEHGKIVEEGKHLELLDKNGYYATLYKAQLRHEIEVEAEQDKL